MKKIGVLLLFAALLFGSWYVVSPWLAMRSLSEAAQTGDVEALERKVDFAALRQSAGDQLGEVVRRQEGQGGVIDAIGSELAERAGRAVIDQMIDADSVGTLVATGAMAAPLLPQRLQGQRIDWDVERSGIDSFRGVGTFEDGTAGPNLLFERDGLGWVMTGFELPPVSAPLAA